MSDTLLQRVAAGETSAVQQVIDTYGGLVWSLARRLSPSREEAEDGVQDVFIALWENADRFDPERGSEVTFVATIARRRLIDRMRRTTRRQRNEADVVDSMSDSAQTEPADVGQLASAEEARQAMKAVEQLTPDQQRVIRLAVHHGYTHEQIARAIDMPLGTVKTHVRRGLIRVRELLAAKEQQSGKGSTVEPVT